MYLILLINNQQKNPSNYIKTRLLPTMILKNKGEKRKNRSEKVKIRQKPVQKMEYYSNPLIKPLDIFYNSGKKF